ncbi:MAG: cobalt-precorrin 5A hydrolase [Eubacteriales bacterium]|nr:cobalt-precorrin 5A hydrolase [Eubacteriales bacterium]
MKLAIISFTEHGSRLNRMLGASLALQGYDCESFCMKKYAEAYELQALEEPLQDWTGRMFSEKDAILFIGATGIAVRSIAPFVKDKMVDPAIVVMDEKGMFAISLLSGHLGGANELTGCLANLTGAIPVITTATDVNGRFAVDVFAKKNRLYIKERKLAKTVSADILDEKPVGFFSELPVIGELPEELSVWSEAEVFEGKTGICVSLDERRQPYRQTLHLIPQIVTLGIGCKKDTPFEKIEERVLSALAHAGISTHALRRMASIDLKAEEKGLLAFAEKYKLDFETFSAKELLRAEGEFSSSSFVQSVTGVDNVCERSAILAGGGKLIQKKSAGDGVTVALAMEDWSVDFG